MYKGLRGERERLTHHKLYRRRLRERERERERERQRERERT